MPDGRALDLARRASLVAAVLSVPVLVLDERAGDGTGPARAANWVLWAVFAVELGITLRTEGARRTLRTEPLLVLLVVLTAPVAPAGLQVGRLLRFVPLLRLLGVAQVARRVLSLDGLRYAGMVLCLVVFGGGCLLPLLEPAQHLSAGDGVWWAIVTVTTVGYGDVVPHTEAGRVLGVLVMASGIGTAALLVAAAGQRIASPRAEADDDLRRQVAELTRAVRELREELAGGDAGARGGPPAGPRP